MANMKKHQFLQVDFATTVRLSAAERKKINQCVAYAGQVLEKEFKKGSLLKTGPKISSVQLSLLLCGDQRMRELNREHRHKDYVTDVLSFPTHEDLRKKRHIEVFNGILFLGDLVVCHGQTKRQAKEFKITYEEEFIHLLIHGLLHLIGYDHEVSKREHELQESWEDRLLSDVSRLKRKS
jgi:probable rRNA maturation factor